MSECGAATVAHTPALRRTVQKQACINNGSSHQIVSRRARKINSQPFVWACRVDVWSPYCLSPREPSSPTAGSGKKARRQGMEDAERLTACTAQTLRHISSAPTKDVRP